MFTCWQCQRNCFPHNAFFVHSHLSYRPKCKSSQSLNYMRENAPGICQKINGMEFQIQYSNTPFHSIGNSPNRNWIRIKRQNCTEFILNWNNRMYRCRVSEEDPNFLLCQHKVLPKLPYGKLLRPLNRQLCQLKRTYVLIFSPFSDHFCWHIHGRQWWMIEFVWHFCISIHYGRKGFDLHPNRSSHKARRRGLGLNGWMRDTSEVE